MIQESNSRSLCESVVSWLDSVPTPNDERESSDNKIRATKRKRRSERLRQSQQPFRKSRRLAEIPGNAMRRTSPRKRVMKEGDIVPEAGRTERMTDLDQTPKAPRSQTIITLDNYSETQPNDLERQLSEHSFSAPSPKRSESVRSSQTGQSRSPTKRLGDTQFSDMPINLVSLASNVPEEVHGLIQDLRKISKGQGVIPRPVRHKMVEDVELYELMEVEEEEEEEKEEGKIAPGYLDHSAFWIRAEEIWCVALECLEKGAPEAAWNSEVHCQLLRLSLRGHWRARGIWYQDITTACVVDKTLLPSIATFPMQSKLVDYAITINSNANFKDRIVKKLGSLPTAIGQRLPPSINATSAEWMRFDPIAVSIETKRETDYQDSGNVQLGMWAAAHFLKLQQLTQNRACKLPVLPVIYVVGHQWRLMLACITTAAKADLLSYLLLGDTSTLSGIYRVIAAIRRLARWVDEEYRPWFEIEVLADGVGKEVSIQSK